MSDILVRKRSQHASIPTAIFENTKLNWKAKGVLAYLLTKPDGWIVRMKNIEALSEDDGEKSVRTVNELHTSGIKPQVVSNASLPQVASYFHMK